MSLIAAIFGNPDDEDSTIPEFGSMKSLEPSDASHRRFAMRDLQNVVSGWPQKPKLYAPDKDRTLLPRRSGYLPTLPAGLYGAQLSDHSGIGVNFRRAGQAVLRLWFDVLAPDNERPLVPFEMLISDSDFPQRAAALGISGTSSFPPFDIRALTSFYIINVEHSVPTYGALEYPTSVADCWPCSDQGTNLSREELASDLVNMIGNAGKRSHKEVQLMLGGRVVELKRRHELTRHAAYAKTKLDLLTTQSPVEREICSLKKILAAAEAEGITAVSTA